MDTSYIRRVQARNYLPQYMVGNDPYWEEFEERWFGDDWQVV